MTTGLARVFLLTLVGAMLLATTMPGEARLRHHRPYHHRHGWRHDHASGVRHEMTTPLLASSPNIRINSVGQVITDVPH